MAVQASFWWNEADDVAEVMADQARYDERCRSHEAELDRAAADIQSANAKYDEALRRFRCAPHGEQRSRQCDLRRANERILAAELKFAEIKRQEPVWD